MVTLNNNVSKTIGSSLMSLAVALRLPRLIALEATNHCFLNCLTCPIPNKMKRQKGVMSLGIFTKLLSQIDWKVERLSWTFGGEPLLNPGLWQMIKLAGQKGIPSKVDTNGMLINQYEQDILNSGLAVLNIAFEGLSKESTTSFRPGYDYELVINNIKKLSQLKEKKGLKKPLISLNYMVRRDNEKGIPLTLKLAKDWKVNFVILKSANISPSCWLSDTQVQQLADRYLPQENTALCRYKKAQGRWIPKEALSNFCRYLLDSVTITWEGMVLPCCFDFDATLPAGNINNQSLRSIWLGAAFRKIRKQIWQHKVLLCHNCTSAALQKKIAINA